MKLATVKGRFLAVLADSTGDADVEPDQVPLKGTVILTPTVSAILDTSGETPATLLPTPVIATLDADGDLSLNGQKGVMVAATTGPDINPSGWTYRVTFNLETSNKIKINYAAYDIELPPDEVTDLTLVARVPSSGGTGVTRGVGVQSVTGRDGAIIFTLTDKTTHEVVIDGAIVSSVNGQSGAVLAGDVRVDQLSDAASASRVALDGLYAEKTAHEELAATVAGMGTGNVSDADLTALNNDLLQADLDRLTEANLYTDTALTDEVTRADAAYAPASLASNVVTSINGQKGAVNLPTVDDAQLAAIAGNTGSAFRAELVETIGEETASPLAAKLDKVEASTTYATNASVTTELQLRVNPLVDQRLADDETVAAAAAAAVDSKLAGGIDTEINTVVDGKKATGELVSGGVFYNSGDDPVFVVVDEDNRRTWLEVSPSGGPTSYAAERIAPAISGPVGNSIGLAEQSTAASGLAFVVADEDGRRTELEVGEDGKFTERVIDSLRARISGLTTITPSKYTMAGDTAEYPIVSGPNIVCWGDSMTAGAGGNGTTYPGVLQGLVGSSRSVQARGVGGESSVTITMRSGATPMLAIPAGNTIPASGSVDLTLLPIGGTDARTPSPLIQGSANWSTGTFAGVPGTITRRLDADGVTGIYSFARSATGAAVTVDRPTAFLSTDAEARRGDIAIIWIGQNGPSHARAKSDVAQIIQHLSAAHKRYIVLSRPTSSDAEDLEWTDLYGRRFFSIRKYLVEYGLADAGITPTDTDIADIAAGRVPTSLRIDGVHFNAHGYTILGTQIYNRLKELRWV